jgi:hypothetical protein
VTGRQFVESRCGRFVVGLLGLTVTSLWIGALAGLALGIAARTYHAVSGEKR